MSLFIVVDSLKEEYLVKLIDLVSMTHIDQGNGPVRDYGMIKGCDSLIELIGEIAEEDAEANEEDEVEQVHQLGHKP